MGKHWGASCKTQPKNRIVKPKTLSEESRRSGLVFDFSSITAWKSFKTQNFNNYLHDEKDFVEKFREVMKIVKELSGRKINEVFHEGSFRHCHVIKDEEADKIVSLLMEKLGIPEQIISCEKLMQVGLEGSVRMVGVISDEIFRVYLIDYNHSLYHDEKKNRDKKSDRKFCPLTGQK